MSDYSIFGYSDDMVTEIDTFPEGTQTPFARAVAAEVRAQLAARNITQEALVAAAGLSSTNYLSLRLRDVKPFDLDDIFRIAVFLAEGQVETFMERARDEHEDRIAKELDLVLATPPVAAGPEPSVDRHVPVESGESDTPQSRPSRRHAGLG